VRSGLTAALLVRRALAALVLMAAALGGAFAQDLQPVPALSARVIDQTGTLDAGQQQALEAKLAAFEQRKGSQIVVLMVPGTAPEDIAAYANRVGNEWKIGRRDVGDGVLVIVAKNERRMRIEVAKTLEGAIPDIAAARIIDEEMKPRFRANDFAGGLDAAATRLIGLVDGEPLPEPAWHDERRGASGFDWEDLAIFLFFAVFVGGPIARAVFGKTLGPLLVGGGAGAVAFFVTASLLVGGIAGMLALIVSLFSGLMPAGGVRRGGRGGWNNGGWSGGGGGWGGGGGFGSGGGGNFGGGGASGDW